MQLFEEFYRNEILGHSTHLNKKHIGLGRHIQLLAVSEF